MQKHVFLAAALALALSACAATKNSNTDTGEKTTEATAATTSTVAEGAKAPAADVVETPTTAPANHPDSAPANPDSAPAAPAAAGDLVTLDSGLQYRDLIVGSGASPQKGQTVVVHYTGWLSEDGEPGAKFDSSLDRGETFKFPIGAGRVIKGWDEGVATMKIGGRRRLIVPPDLGYGDRDLGVIPPNSTLIFDVQLFGLE
jgi:peptidylprolyl isomerase